MSTGKGLATFQRIVVPSSSGSSFCAWRPYYCSNRRYVRTIRQDVISQNTRIVSGTMVRPSNLTSQISFTAFFKIDEVFRSEVSVVPFGAVFLTICYTLAMSVPQIQMPHFQFGVLRLQMAGNVARLNFGVPWTATSRQETPIYTIHSHGFRRRFITVIT